MEQSHCKKHIIDYPLEDCDETVDFAMAGTFTTLEINDPFDTPLMRKPKFLNLLHRLGVQLHTMMNNAPCFCLHLLTLTI